MGFGLLLGGYFLAFAFSLSEIYLFTDILGGLWMLYAFSKLSQYNRYCNGAVFAGIAFTLACMTGAGVLFAGILVQDGILDILIDCLKTVFAAVLHFFMYLSIRGIAQGADCPKLVHKSTRNMYMMGIYYLLYFLVLATGFLYSDYLPYVSGCVYLYWLICFIFNLILLYNCFGMLYPAEEEQETPKKSRFAIVNKMNEMFDKLDEKNNKYRRESMQMALQEAEKLHRSRKKNGKKKKNKYK